jgi:hypothetical protein
LLNTARPMLMWSSSITCTVAGQKRLDTPFRKVKPKMHIVLTHRTAVLGLATSLGLALRPAISFAAPTEIRVAKDPNCGCCSAWIEVLKADGFTVNVELLDYDALQTHKVASGIPADMFSCHTAHVGGYVVEGHVPPIDVRRLLANRPDAIGLSVPGMPYGSPGMGPENEREAYTVHLIDKDGSTEVFAIYDSV